MVMRGEAEMMELILETARADERVRAVILNGSRANPEAPRDIFQDFDVVYVVTDVAPFRDDPAWTERLGEMMIMQTPEAMQDPPPSEDGRFAYLMQFADGNRIDLTLYPLAQLETMDRDSLSVLLLDKDGIIEPFPPPDESDYLPRPPTAKLFADCCNEFWWMSTYVAKGLWRREILYAKYMLEVVQEQLRRMLAWHIGRQTGFERNPGKQGKYFEQYLEPELWQMMLATYADAGYDHTWQALFAAGDLFRRVAIPLAEQYGFEYPHADDRRVTAHLAHVQSLPRNAKQMY